MMYQFAIKAGLALAQGATEAVEQAAGNRCPDNSYPPCFWLRHLLFYTLLFALIGLFIGLVSKRYMPNGEGTSYLANCILGIIGSVTGGLFWLVNRWTSWNATIIPEGSLYTRVESYNLVPAYLLSLLVAPMTALLALAGYRLIRNRGQI